MGSKKIIRIGALDKEWCKSLHNNRIVTCKDVLSKNVVELMNILQSYKASSELLAIVGKTVAPKSCTAFQLMQREHSRFLLTSLPALDQLLHGGLLMGSITELAGPPGCGKTQFSMMISAVIATSICDHGTCDSIIYIDTENSFSAGRLQEMIQHKVGNFTANTGIDVSNVASRVIVFMESTLLMFHQRLKSLEEIIISKKVKMIIVDSIASLFRKELGQQANYDRNQMLMKVAAMLKYYAETFGICVLVTNQIAKVVQTSELVEDWRVIPALGNTWSHAVNTRLMVTVDETDIREMCLVKSPIAPPLSVLFRIDSEGIVIVKR